MTSDGSTRSSADLTCSALRRSACTCGPSSSRVRWTTLTTDAPGGAVRRSQVPRTPAAPVNSTVPSATGSRYEIHCGRRRAEPLRAPARVVLPSQQDPLLLAGLLLTPVCMDENGHRHEGEERFGAEGQAAEWDARYPQKEGATWSGRTAERGVGKECGRACRS